jgi:translation initiation factor eIF-2B subunit beta
MHLQCSAVSSVNPEYTVGNTIAKVLHHIREEYLTATKGSVTASSTPGGPSAFSIAKFVLQGQPRTQNTAFKSAEDGTEERLTLRENDPDDPDSFARGLKPVLMEAIQDVLDELETVYDNVSKNAKDHIHAEYGESTGSTYLRLILPIVKLSSLLDGPRQSTLF